MNHYQNEEPVSATITHCLLYEDQPTIYNERRRSTVYACLLFKIETMEELRDFRFLLSQEKATLHEMCAYDAATSMSIYVFSVDWTS